MPPGRMFAPHGIPLRLVPVPDVPACSHVVGEDATSCGTTNALKFGGPTETAKDKSIFAIITTRGWKFYLDWLVALVLR